MAALTFKQIFPIKPLRKHYLGSGANAFGLSRQHHRRAPGASSM
jgi:hypothetical protein